ncbi:hypothetical protein FNF28_01307 [Cafeteria roenbergensis]|uniref:F-box domain-containing protein n=1 Tax=Cafeteria roenbergensis TaxID=33653 RepID=A0A5A8DZ66_CAFRO|nr:hypothetical protein FNF28_01307 [Cafeteria roenbergensis]
MASAREGRPDSSRASVLSGGRALASVFAYLRPADVAKAARTCRAFAATAKRGAVWAGRPIVAAALAEAASGAPDARAASSRLSGLDASGAASAIIGVQGAWEAAGAVTDASGAAQVPQFQAPTTKHGDSAVGEAVAALDLFPGDAPWLRSALSPSPAATAADMVLGGASPGPALGRIFR